MIRMTLRTAKNAARATLSSVPAPLWQRLFPKDVLALGYHMVSDEDLPHLRLYPHKNARQFEADVAFAQGRTVEYANLVGHRLRGTPLPRNGFLFTFDDGFAECFHVVRPILRKYGVGGVFFISAAFIDDRAVFYETKLSLCISAIVQLDERRVRAVSKSLGRDFLTTPSGTMKHARPLLARARIDNALGREQRRLLLALFARGREDEALLDHLCDMLSVDATAYTSRRKVFMSAGELRTLASEGYTVGGHGLSHLSLEAMTHDQIEHEIVASCETIRDITGQRRVPFAFPYGGRGIDRALLAAIVARHPFIEMFFDSGPLCRSSPIVVDRVWAEDPTAARDATNLPQMLRRACSTPSAWFRANA